MALAAQPRILDGRPLTVPPALRDAIGADRWNEAFAAMVRALGSGEPVAKLGPVFCFGRDLHATDYRIVREDRS